MLLEFVTSIVLFGTMPGYSSTMLKRIKLLCPKKVKLCDSVFLRIKAYGILKPCRGSMPVTFSERRIPVLTRNNRNERPSPCYVNKQNLTDVTFISEKWLKIPTIVTNRIDYEHNDLHQNKPENLITVPKTSYAPCMSLGVMNCQSVRNKADFLSDYIMDKKMDCVALTETWLGQNDSDAAVKSALTPEGYKFMHVPRVGQRGGGVAVICKERYTVKVEPSVKASSFESINVLLSVASYTFRLIVIYRVPPSKKNKLSKSTFITEFADLLEESAIWSGKLVICGDFNIHWDNEQDSERKTFFSLLDSFGMSQHVTTTTHTDGHILDFLITRTDENVFKSCSVEEFISDHRAIIANMNCGKLHAKRKEITYRKVKGIDCTTFGEDIAASKLCHSTTVTVDESVSNYNEVLSNILDKHAPLKTKAITEKEQAPWIDESVLEAKRVRRRSEMKWRKTRLTVHKQIFMKDCLHVRKLVQSAKSKLYHQQIEQCEGDQQKLFKIIESMLGKGKATALPTAVRPPASFNHFFISKIALICTNISELDDSTSDMPFSLDTLLVPSAVTI